MPTNDTRNVGNCDSGDSISVKPMESDPPIKYENAETCSTALEAIGLNEKLNL